MIFQRSAGLLFVPLGAILYEFLKSTESRGGVRGKKLLTEHTAGFVIGNREGPISIGSFSGVGARCLPKRAPGVPANEWKRLPSEEHPGGETSGLALGLVVFQKCLQPPSRLIRHSARKGFETADQDIEPSLSGVQTGSNGLWLLGEIGRQSVKAGLFVRRQGRKGFNLLWGCDAFQTGKKLSNR